MNYKMVVIDIDDTLLNDAREITPGTRQSLAAAVDKGTVVTLATGRMYASARGVAGQLGLNVPIITYQGSLIKNALDGQVLYERTVPREAAEMLFRYAQERNLHIQAYCHDVLYTRMDNQRVKEYAAISEIPYTVEPDFDRLLNEPLTKILFIDEPEQCDRLADELKPLVGGLVHITKSKPNYLEFIHPEGTKGHALRYLAGHYGIDLNEVIAIGDSWNDRDMIELAGLGVAMGNAVPALKELADYVTRTNNEEGVRHVIEQFVLNA